MGDNVNKVKTFDEEIHDIEDTQARTDIANRYTKAEVDTLLSGKVNNDEVYDKSTLNSILDSKADETSVYTKAEADVLLNSKANVSNVYTRTEADSIFNTKANASDVYTKTQADDLLSAKANASDVYTKTEADTLLGAKADSSDVYTKTEADTLLGAKADSSDVYTKTEADTLLGAKANSADVYTITQTDVLLDTKCGIDDSSITSTVATWSADKLNVDFGSKADSADVYNKTEVYTKAEVDALIGGIKMKTYYTKVNMDSTHVATVDISSLNLSSIDDYFVIINGGNVADYSGSTYNGGANWSLYIDDKTTTSFTIKAQGNGLTNWRGNMDISCQVIYN